MSKPTLSEPQVSINEIAQRAGVQPVTIRGYVFSGRMPAADGYVGTTPFWWESTVEQYLAARADGPGLGWRKGITDYERQHNG